MGQPKQRINMFDPAVFGIRINGKLSESWSEYFGARSMSVDEDGDGTVDLSKDPDVIAVDLDNDGVDDSIDACHDTPEGCSVDSTGCPSDSDSDGVCNGLDKCSGYNDSMDHDGDGIPDACDRDAPMGPQPGDVNGDRIIDLTDAVLTLQVNAGMKTSVTVDKEADVNDDGKIGSEESVYILQEVSELR